MESKSAKQCGEEGAAVMMFHPIGNARKGKRSRHQRTATFSVGKDTGPGKEYRSLSPKEAMDRDLKELREIYTEDGLTSGADGIRLEAAIQNIKGGSKRGRS